ncbi:MAG: hypothetical protein JM58_16005 [Peptococcaceae bacterium BICA1-8]|nr:MAG: hypothetical protein JM58_16005 [Peptococcaceae bacterium BICA1-8]
MGLHDKLNSQQLNVIRHNKLAILVVSGPGTGKTTTSVNYIAEIISKRYALPNEIMAVTFTNKAADEMKVRVNNLVGTKPHISTIHSFANSVLRKYPPPGYNNNFKIIDERKQFGIIANMLKEMNLEFHPQYVLERLTLARNSRIKNILEQEKLVDFYQLYMNKLRDINSIDYDGLLTWCLNMFEKNPHVLEYYQDRYKYVLVDEFQDISSIQYGIIYNIVQKNRNLLCVGDFDQSIYGWRGSDVSIMLNLKKDFPELTTLYLEENYRSTPNIIEMANRLIKNNTRRKEKPLWTKNERGSEPTIKVYFDEHKEANDIALTISNAVKKGKNYSDFAILYRVHVRSRIFEEVLSNERIPYQVIGGTGYYQQKEIQNIIAFYKLAVEPNNEEAISRIVAMLYQINDKKNKITIGTTKNHDVSLMELTQFADENYIRGIPELIMQISKISSLEEIFDQIIKYINYLKYLGRDNSIQGEKRLENVEELRSVLYHFDQAGKNVKEFIQFAENTHTDEKQASVKLMTAHAAKGLEFDTTFVVGVEQGLFPYYKHDSEEEIEEERRLLYVAITRAKNILQISYPLKRVVKGKSISIQPSQFLIELGPETQTINKKYNFRDRLSKDEISKGSVIIHSHFGKGYIAGINEQQTVTELTIDFIEVGIKKIILEYANMQLG